MNPQTSLERAEVTSSAIPVNSSLGTGTKTGALIESELRPFSKDAELRFLAPDELPLWDALVDISPQGSPFVRSWWLQALGGEVRIMGYFRRHQLLAGIPLYFEKRFGIRLCTMPKLTQTLGPIFQPQAGRRTKDCLEENEFLSSFAEELSRHYVFFQGFHPSVQNWSPFYWKGFSQTSRATHIIELENLDGVWENIAHGTRQRVQRARNAGIAVKTCTAEEVWLAEEKTFSRQHMPMPHSLDYLRNLHRSATEHDAGDCFAAIDTQQNVLAAAFAIWDRNRAYVVALGTDPNSHNIGAPALLVWHLIQTAAARSRVLDFSGSMLPGIDRFWRNFGTTQVPYSWIMKFPLWLKIYLAARHKI